MVDTHHVDGVLQMFDGIEDICLFGLRFEETIVQRDLHDTTGGCQAAHLVVGEVARMVAEGATRAVAADDGRLADVEGIVERLVAGMAEVHHQSEAVHLADDLLAEAADAIVGVTAPAGVAQVVVAIMAQRDIDHAAFGKVPDVLELSAECQTVLDAQHDAFAAVALVLVEVAGGAGNTKVAVVLTYNFLDFIEDQVGILCRTLHVEVYLAREGLADFRLRQVGYHDSGILPALRHLVQVDENARVTLLKVNTLREEHRCVAMGVERQHTVV